MKKNALLKLLSVVIGVMVIVASVVCLTTVNAAEDFGTEADGITVNAKDAMNSWTATEGLKNGDFSEGLKYWGPSNYGSTTDDMKTSNIVNLLEDNGNKYVQLNGALSYKNSGIQTTVVKVPATQVAKGDKLAVMYKGDAAPTSAQAKVILRQFNVSGGKNDISATDAPYITVYKADNSTWAVLNGKSGTVLENATASDYYTFAVEFRATSKTSVARFDDVKIVKVEDDGFYTLDGVKIDEDGNPVGGSGDGEGGEVTPPPATPSGVTVTGEPINSKWVGTEADGIATDKSGTLAYTPHALGFQNGDFEQGFKYWGREVKEENVEWKPSQLASIETETNGNKYLHFQYDENTFVSTSTSKYQALRTICFSIDDSKLEKGDSIAVMGNYKKGTVLTNFQIKLELRNVASGAGWTAMPNSAWGTSAVKMATDTEWGVFAHTTGAVVGEKSYSAFQQYKDTHLAVYIAIGANGKYTSGDFDNLRIVKLKDGVYTELDGTPIDLGGGDGEGEGGEVSNDPAWAGTANEGVTMYQGDHINNVLMGDFVNGDFEKGLKYWAAKSTAYYPSDVSEIKTEANGNKYVYLKGASAGYYGFKTGVITIPDSKLAVGDQLVIVFDYKSNEDANCIQIPLTQRYAGDRLTQTFAGDLIIGDEWCTGYIGAKPGITLAERKTGNNPGYAESGYYAFQMMVECKQAGDTISLDNIRIAKLVGNKIIDLDGNVISEDVSNPVDNTTGSGSTGGSTGGSGSTGTGNGNGSGTNSGSSATTGETLPVMPMAVAGIVLAASAVILRKKVR